MEYILEMKDISKTFPGVKALDHVQLQVRPGEVHALMGENGAGKSTLMKILMGIYTRDAGGEILFDGKPYMVSNPKEAMDMGVAMIHQELNPILDMTVYENIFVGRELRKNGLVDKKAEIEQAQKLIEECGLHVSPKESASSSRSSRRSPSTPRLSSWMSPLPPSPTGKWSCCLDISAA